MNNKFFLKSRTIIGILASSIPQLAIVFGITLSGDATVMISTVADSVIQLSGLLYAAYGRFTATESLTLKAK